MKDWRGYVLQPTCVKSCDPCPVHTCIPHFVLRPNVTYCLYVINVNAEHTQGWSKCWFWIRSLWYTSCHESLVLATDHGDLPPVKYWGSWLVKGMACLTVIIAAPTHPYSAIVGCNGLRWCSLGWILVGKFIGWRQVFLFVFVWEDILSLCCILSFDCSRSSESYWSPSNVNIETGFQSYFPVSSSTVLIADDPHSWKPTSEFPVCLERLTCCWLTCCFVQR